MFTIKQSIFAGSLALTLSFDSYGGGGAGAGGLIKQKLIL